MTPACMTSAAGALKSSLRLVPEVRASEAQCLRSGQARHILSAASMLLRGALAGFMNARFLVFVQAGFTTSPNGAGGILVS